MVKRKAANSLDEWLSEGDLASAAKQPNTEITTEPCTTPPPPTAEIVQPQVASEPSLVVTAKVDITEDEAANWFWSLLEQSGYERW